MKTLTFLLIALLAGPGPVFSSMPRTSGDMYMESYAAAMRRQAMMSTADIRAGDYRAGTEAYDQHHNLRQLGELALTNQAVRLTTLTPVEKTAVTYERQTGFEGGRGILAWFRPEIA